jgi:hypothetical protein
MQTLGVQIRHASSRDTVEKNQNIAFARRHLEMFKLLTCSLLATVAAIPLWTSLGPSFSSGVLEEEVPKMLG